MVALDRVRKDDGAGPCDPRAISPTIDVLVVVVRLIAAAIAIERETGRVQGLAGRHEDRLQIHAGRPHALFGFGQDVEPHHADREERAGRGAGNCTGSAFCSRRSVRWKYDVSDRLASHGVTACAS